MKVTDLTESAEAKAKKIAESLVAEGIETVKHPNGTRPKGIGWELKQAGEQSGKEYSVWQRKTLAFGPSPADKLSIKASKKVEESLNDDDYYVVDADAKKILKHLGKRSVPYGQDPSEVLKDYIKDPKTQKVMTGMKAKHSKIQEGRAPETRIKTDDGTFFVSKKSDEYTIRKMRELYPVLIKDGEMTSHWWAGRSIKTTAEYKKVIAEFEAMSSKINESIKDFEKWKQAVIAKYPTKAGQLKFKGRIENGVDTISAEVPGEDRSYGVWDQDKEEGVVLSEGIDLTGKDKHSFIGRIKRGNEANNKGWGKFGAILASGLKANSPEEKHREVRNLGRDSNRYKNLVDRNLTPGGFPKVKAKHVEKAEQKAAKKAMSVQETISSMTDAADRFKASLAARLKPLGFKRDRDTFVSEDKVISVQIDLDENDAWLSWKVGTMNGSRQKFTESGDGPLQDSAEILKTLMTFAKA